MPKDLTQKFMQALQAAEVSGDVSPLVELYADDSTTTNLTQQVHQGREGAREFWEKYLANFQTIRSEFHHTTDDDQSGVMEWTSKGQLKGGKPINYPGVSIIECEGGKVTKFRTYYDSAAFVLEMAENSAG